MSKELIKAAAYAGAGAIPVVGEVIDAVDLVRSVVTGDPLGIITSLVGLVTPGVSGKSIKFGKEILQEIGVSGVDDFVKASKKALKQVDADEIARLSSNGVTKADIQESLTSLSKEARLKKRAIKNMSDAEFTKTYGYSRQAIKEEMDELIAQHGTSARFKNQNHELNYERAKALALKTTSETDPSFAAKVQEKLKGIESDNIEYADVWYKLYNGELDWPIIKGGSENVSARHVVEAALQNHKAKTQSVEWIASWKGAATDVDRSAARGFRSNPNVGAVTNDKVREYFQGMERDAAFTKPDEHGRKIPQISYTPTAKIWTGSKNTAINYADPDNVSAKRLAELKQDYVTQHDWAGSDRAQEVFEKAEKTRKGLQTRYDKKEVKSKTILDQFGREKPRKYTPLTADDVADIDSLYEPYKIISDIEGTELIQTGGLYPVLLKQAPGQLKTISFGGLSYKTSKAVDYPTALGGVKTVKGGVNKQAESYLRSGSNPTRTLAITDVKDPVSVGTSYASRPGAITLVRASGGNLNYFNYF